MLAADSVIPVVVDVGIPRGDLRRAYTWALPEEHRGKPTVTDVALQGDGVLVASPAAGGLVRIERATGAISLLPLDGSPLRLAVDGPTAWVVCSSEPVAAPGDGRAPSPLLHHPVLREQSIEHGHEGRQERMPADHREIARTTPVWRIAGDSVQKVDLGGEVSAEGAFAGQLVTVCRLPTDPLVERVGPRYVSIYRPATVLVHDGDGAVRRLGSVDDAMGEVWIDGPEVWLLGFNRDHFSDGPCEVRPVDIAGAVLGDPLPVFVSRPLAVLDRQLAELVWPERAGCGPGWPDLAEGNGDEPRSGLLLRLVPVYGGEESTISVPRVESRCLRQGKSLWFRSLRRPALVEVDVGDRTVREIRMDIDCRPYVPLAVPPPGVDLKRYERNQLEDIRGSLLGGWCSQDGSRLPFIRGVTFQSVELRGEFPGSEVVALFRSRERPGVLFGRRWPLYDDLGNLAPLEVADINLMEDVEASGHGLPPLRACIPDTDGIVWF